jgi:hypothetical protein
VRRMAIGFAPPSSDFDARDNNRSLGGIRKLIPPASGRVDSKWT